MRTAIALGLIAFVVFSFVATALIPLGITQDSIPLFILGIVAVLIALGALDFVIGGLFVHALTVDFH